MGGVDRVKANARLARGEGRSRGVSQVQHLLRVSTRGTSALRTGKPTRCGADSGMPRTAPHVELFDRVGVQRHPASEAVQKIGSYGGAVPYAGCTSLFLRSRQRTRASAIWVPPRLFCEKHKVITTYAIGRSFPTTREALLHRPGLSGPSTAIFPEIVDFRRFLANLLCRHIPDITLSAGSIFRSSLARSAFHFHPAFRSDAGADLHRPSRAQPRFRHRDSGFSGRPPILAFSACPVRRRHHLPQYGSRTEALRAPSGLLMDHAASALAFWQIGQKQAKSARSVTSDRPYKAGPMLVSRLTDRHRSAMSGLGYGHLHDTDSLDARK